MTASQVAVFASRAFGAPLFDLNGFDLDHINKELVDPKMAAMRRVLPLQKRGNRLFVAVSDPANLQALDEVRFKTNLVIDAVVVEDDKLGQTIAKVVESMGQTLKDLVSAEDLEIDLQDGAPATADEEANPDVEDAPVVKYIQKILLDAIGAGRVGHPFRAVRKVLSHPLPARRDPEGSRAAAAGDQGQDGVADQGHLASSTSRKSACRRTGG